MGVVTGGGKGREMYSFCKRWALRGQGPWCSAVPSAVDATIRGSCVWPVAVTVSQHGCGANSVCRCVVDRHAGHATLHHCRF